MARNTATGRLERVLFISFVVIGYIVPTISEFAETTIPENLFWLVAAATASVTLILDRKGILASIRSSTPLALLLLLALISPAWSDDPGTSVRRSVALLASGAISLCVARRLGIETFLQTLGIALAIVASVSIACIALLPDIGLAPDGDWQGCLTRKNTLGQVMVLGVMSLSCIIPGLRDWKRVAAFATIAFMFILLVGARSGTSLVVALAIGALATLALWARRKFATRPRRLVALAFCIVAVVGVSSSIGQEAALDTLGKDTTLTGRTDVWQFAIEAIGQRPLLGYGYKVFWLSNGYEDPSARTGTWATQAHNGLIEIGLDLGVTGMLAAIFFVGAALHRSALFFWRGRNFVTCWPLFVFVAFVLTNFTEATIAKYNDVSWTLVVAAFFYAAGAHSPEDGFPRATSEIE